MDDRLKPLDATPREICVENLSSYLALWREKAERIVVLASSSHIAHIQEAQWVLAKFGMIISNLLTYRTISEDELATTSPKKNLKMQRYFRLLEGLDLVQKIPTGYAYGNLFAELRTKFPDPKEFQMAVLSHIIRERYSTLREIFNISQLETFVHMESTYYEPALEAESLQYWTGDSIVSHYRDIYGRQTQRLRLNYILSQLVQVKALKLEDRYYFGNEQLFSDMLNLKQEIGDLVPRRA